MDNNIFTNLREKVKDSNISNLSKRVGLSRGTLYDFLNEREVKSSTIEKLLIFFNFEITPSLIFRPDLSVFQFDKTKIQSVEKIIDIIIQEANPEKIIIFGSQARGDWSDESDFDIAYINPQLKGKRVDIMRLSRINKLNLKVEIIPIREDDPRSVFSPIYSSIKKEGVLVYHNKKIAPTKIAQFEYEKLSPLKDIQVGPRKS